MSDDVKESEKTHKRVEPDLLCQSPFTSDNPFLFQIFFLSQDQDQSVEVVETEEIDFGEITQRLKLGESVFIKNTKTRKSLNPVRG